MPGPAPEPGPLPSSCCFPEGLTPPELQPSARSVEMALGMGWGLPSHPHREVQGNCLHPGPLTSDSGAYCVPGAHQMQRPPAPSPREAQSGERRVSSQQATEGGT